jgi:hypothetical protein
MDIDIVMFIDMDIDMDVDVDIDIDMGIDLPISLLTDSKSEHWNVRKSPFDFKF